MNDDAVGEDGGGVDFDAADAEAMKAAVVFEGCDVFNVDANVDVDGIGGGSAAASVVGAVPASAV